MFKLILEGIVVGIMFVVVLVALASCLGLTAVGIALLGEYMGMAKKAAAGLSIMMTLSILVVGIIASLHVHEERQKGR